MAERRRTEVAGGEYMEFTPWCKPIPKAKLVLECRGGRSLPDSVPATGAEVNGPEFMVIARTYTVHWEEDGNILPCRYDDCPYGSNPPSTKPKPKPKQAKAPKKVRIPKTPAFSKVVTRSIETGEVTKVTPAIKPKRVTKSAEDSAQIEKFIRERFGWTGEITPRIRQLAKDAISHQASVLAYIQK